MFDEGVIAPPLTPITWLWDGDGVAEEGIISPPLTPITWLVDGDGVAEEGEGVFTEGVRGEVEDGVTVVVAGLTDESRGRLIGSVGVEDGGTGVVMGGATTVSSGIPP